MKRVKRTLLPQGREHVETSLTGQEILRNPLLNKGTAFTHHEREQFGLLGLLPPHESTLDEQVERRYRNFQECSSDISRYNMLSSLMNRNETLFYRLVAGHVGEMMPYIYTPTVGSASLEFSYLYNQDRGVYFSYAMKDKVDEIVDTIDREHLDVIVITDGERILGLGDLGVGGMAIPVGKLSLYTIFGGVSPARTLPAFIDVGTDNPELLNDPLYLGWRHKRVRGDEYNNFVDRVVKAIKRRFPGVLLQWEDFAKQNAKPLLDRYRNEICSFNDDIQGTAAVAFAAILSAVKALKQKLSDQRIAIFGGGSAGMGIAHMIVQGLTDDGLSEKEAWDHLYIIDVEGLTRSVDWNVEGFIGLKEVVEHAKPTVLIGASAQAGAFTQEIIQTMAKHTKHPVILPLSNPTANAEANPSDLRKWTQNQAIIATGSPFPNTTQCNNVYIFPGLGKGIIEAKATVIKDHHFIKAANILAAHSPMIDGIDNPLFPPLEKLPEISKHIASALAKEITGREMKDEIEDRWWQGDYPSFAKAGS